MIPLHCSSYVGKRSVSLADFVSGGQENSYLPENWPSMSEHGKQSETQNVASIIYHM